MTVTTMMLPSRRVKKRLNSLRTSCPAAWPRRAGLPVAGAGSPEAGAPVALAITSPKAKRSIETLGRRDHLHFRGGALVARLGLVVRNYRCLVQELQTGVGFRQPGERPR